MAKETKIPVKTINKIIEFFMKAKRSGIPGPMYASLILS
jgi:hypothetical protein